MTKILRSKIRSKSKIFELGSFDDYYINDYYINWYNVPTDQITFYTTGSYSSSDSYLRFGSGNSSE